MNNLLAFYRGLIAQNRRWFWAVVIVFLIGFVSGVCISLVAPSVTQTIIDEYASSLDPSVKPGLPLSLYVFERNAIIVLITTVGGFLFGLLPVVVGFMNGLVLGALVGFPQIYQALNPVQLFFLIAPHGIFEYAGSLLALSFGLKLGLNWLFGAARGKRKMVFFTDLKETLAIIPLTLALLLAAAFVEGTLTTNIACFVAGAC